MRNDARRQLSRWVLIAGATGIWLAARLWVLFVTRLFVPWAPNDVLIYERWARELSQGSFPIGDQEWQYPDGAALVIMPPTLHPDYVYGFVALMLAVDLVILVALSVAFLRRPDASAWGLVLWATAGFWIGPVLLGRLDLAPTLFAVFGALLLARPGVAGALAGVGAAIKLWPVAVLSGLSGRRQLLRGTLWGTVSAGLLTLAVRLIIPDGDYFLANQASRGLHVQAVPALPFLLGRLVGMPLNLTQTNGTVEIAAPAAELVGLASMAIGVVAAAAITVTNWRGRLGSIPPADVVATTVLILVATNRVMSPQFATWAGGVLSVALLARRSRLRPVAMVYLLSAVTSQYVYPFMTGYNDAEWDAIAAAALTSSLVLVAAAWAWYRLWLERDSRPRSRTDLTATQERMGLRVQRSGLHEPL